LIVDGDVEDFVFETERLIMRPYETQDAESVFKVVRLREIAETTISLPHPYPRETVDWWISFVRGEHGKRKCI
jgi:ribosomal-protein-alanine N-acetyltransferase